jgi:hypothetical protein
VPLDPWAAVADLPADRPALPGGDEEWERVIALATSVLFTLSGRGWAGRRTRTVEVVAVRGARWAEVAAGPDFWWDGSWGAHVEDGEIVNHSCCDAPLAVRLPHSPVRAIESVTVGGVLRGPDTYRLRDGRWLEDRTRRGWPTCDPGLVVVYTAGTDPPPEARDAARTLALHLAYARAGDARCRLPSNVTAATRQGISQSFTPAAELIAAGRTGLTDVDLWLGTVNPTARRHRPSSWSPDTHPRTYTRPEE